MKPMLLHHCLLVSAGLALISCGKSQPAAPVAAPPPSPPPVQAMPSLSGGAPPPPPPPGSVSGVAPATTPGEKVTATAQTGLSNFALEDDEGNPLTDAVQILQRAAEVYDDKRSDDEEKPWPELTDLALLTKYKILNRLPSAPPGKKFVFNPRTKQVTLAQQ